MNRIYHLVWNRALRVLQVASELVSRSQGGADRACGLKGMPQTALALALAAAITGLPSLAHAQSTASGGGGTGSSPSAQSSMVGGSGGSAGVNGPTAGSGYQAGGAASTPGANGGNASNVDVENAGAGGGGAGANGGTSLGTSTLTGGNGGNGAYNNWGGAGGGGAGGFGAVLVGASGSLANQAAITGGTGGTGGWGGWGGGGGGGGGTGLYASTNTLGTSLTLNAAVTGGAGGAGGNSDGGGYNVAAGAGGNSSGAGGASVTGNGGSAGGSGGGGGAGVSFVSSASGATTVTDNTVVTGGNGGNGGEDGGSNGTGGGNGGSGGAGMTLSGTQITLINSGSIIGGNGGQGGACDTFCTGVAGSSGSGGVGLIVSGGNNTIVNNGSISSGLSGDGSTRAAAIDLFGGGNTLVLEVGSSITGDIVSASGSTNGGDTLILTDNASGGGSDSLDIGTVSGFATFEKTGSSTWIVTGSTASTAPWTISAGTLALSGNGSIADSRDVSVAGGATFDISATTGGASIVSLDGASSVGSTSTVNLGSQTLTLTNASGTFAGQIIGNGGLSVSGGTETLSGFNSYTGATTINNGATLIDLTSVGALTSTTAFNLDSGTLELNNANLTTSAAVTLGSGGGTFSILGTTGGQRRSLELDGMVTGAGGLDFIADGSDSLILTNADNTYSGGTTLTRASPFAPGALPALVVEATGALGSGGVTAGVGTSLAFYGTSSNTIDAGARTIQLDGDDNLTFSDATAGQATITMASQTIGGTLVNFNAGSDAGTSSITVGGADNLTFNQDSSAASASIDNAGQTNEFAFTNFGSGSTAGNATIDNSFWGITQFTDASAGSANITNGYTSATTLQDSDAGTAAFTNVGSSSLPSTVDANNDNYYVGGVLEIFGSTDASRATVVNNAGGAVYVSGFQGDPLVDPSIGSLSGAGAVLLGSSYDANGNAIPFDLTLGALGNDDTISGVIRDDTQQLGVSFGDGITKAGRGTLTLDGINTYSGLTEVQGGTLVIGNSSSPTASIAGSAQVDSGATLRGQGSVGGNVNVLTGGIVTPGDFIGTLTVNGNFTAAQGSLMDFAFGAPGANLQTAGTGDSVAVGGNLELDGAILNVTDAGGMGPGLYNVFTYGGTLTETNGGLTLGITPTGQTIALQNLTAQNQINLIDTTGYMLDFWNANGLASATQMGGGSGTWSITSQNWTDATGSVTASMQPQPGFAIFVGAPGTVTIDNSAANVSATGLQFAVNGYTLTGDTLTLVADSDGDAPIIRVGDGSSAGDGMTATINDVIAGTAGLTKTDLGTLVLTGANTFTGGLAIDGGTLSVSADANLGNASNALTLNGSTLENTAAFATARSVTLSSGSGTFQTDANLTASGVIDGTGALTKTGSGTLTLSGTNTYTGGTTISAGTLQIGNGGTSGSMVGNVTDNGVLAFDRSDAVSFGGVVSGTGSLTQAGSGILILDGNSSAFAGTTTVAAGTLEVGDAATSTASLGGNVQVDTGGTLRGHGSVGGNVTNSGTVWAGGSIGTLTIQGNYAQTAQGILEVEATPAGQTSLLAVDGTSSLAGSALVLSDAGTWAPLTSYTILTATGGITGQFASASSSLVFLDPVLSYTANAVDLSLQRNDISFASVVQTPNQKAVAPVADSFGFGNPVYSALTTLDAATARRAFDQLSGVIYPSASTALIDDSRYVRDAINRHLLGLNNDGAEGSTTDGVSAWTSAWGHGGHNDDDVNTPALQANGSGLLVGADLPLGADARLGAVLGHGQNSIQSNSVGSSAHVLGEHVGLYGSDAFGAFVLRAGAVYSWQDVHTNRAVAFGNYSDWLTSEHHAQTAQAYVEGGYQFSLSPGQQLEPFANIARVRVHNDALQEDGGNAALAVAANSVIVNTATLGLRDTWALDAANDIHAHASVGWQQAWGDLTPVTSMRFVAGGDSFAIEGMPVAHHAATTDLGIELKLAKNVTFDASYLGQFASGVQDQGARMSLTVTF